MDRRQSEVTQMCSQSPRNLETKRREYLSKKGFANARAWSVGCATVCLALLAVFIGIPLGFVLVVLVCRDGLLPLSSYVIAALAAVAVLCGLAAFSSRVYVSLDQKARFIPYVPPVRDQIAALPAEDVLLRGSGALVQGEYDLLRAAQPQIAAPADELLRAHS